MKPLAAIALAAAFSCAAMPVSAKTVTNTSTTANEQAVNGVAGPPPHKKLASAKEKSSAQPSKTALKKSKITPPPPLHDPN